MEVNAKLLVAVGAAPENADKYIHTLNELMNKYEISTPLRCAHFLAQLFHESGRLRLVEENLNYSADGLVKTFRKYFKSKAEAQRFHRQRELIGNRVYASRLGNGNEASGDGYRYRGRGLIQLTGKANYADFGRWLGDDAIVGKPDSVASDFPVHSAVYFWDTRKINDLADKDDVVAVTRKINGGKNGLADRKSYLNKFKQQLREMVTPELAPTITVVVPQRLEPTHAVTASELNLRNRPQISPGSKIAVLPQGTEVAKLEGGDHDKWWKIQAELQGQLFHGFVAPQYLAPVKVSITEAVAFAAAEAIMQLPFAHLSENKATITRTSTGGRAHPLGEAGRPGRKGTIPVERVNELVAIVNYLDSENRQHKRYQPGGGSTFCNIYAHDYCYLADTFLPRVWWTDAALTRIQRGEPVKVQYSNTVRELNANALHDWLEDYGEVFGWQRVTDVDPLQRAANDGEICLIVAKRRDLNRSGHVVVVVPEHEELLAARTSQGEILRPLESQAGTKNFRFVVKHNRWWQNDQFSSYGFWRRS